MKLKKIISLVLLTTFFSNNLVVLANPVQRKNQIEQQLQITKNKYNEVIEEINKLEEKIENIDSEIYEKEEEIRLNKIKIEEINKRIKIKEKEIIEKENLVIKKKKIADERIRNIYINGATDYLAVLFSVTSFSDFITKLDILKTIIEFDNKIINDVKLQIEDLNKKKESLNNTKLEVITVYKQNKNILKELEQKRLEMNNLISSLNEKRRIYINEIEDYNKEIQKLYRQIEEERKRRSEEQKNKENNNKKQQSRGENTNNVTGQDIVDYAMNFLGVPYVWGGTTPKGFDCSGFVQYVYGHFGIKLPRVSRDQAKVGITINSIEEAQPGDLVFFGNPIHHVGIYIGDGKYIHAPHTGDVVKISSLKGRNLTLIKRIIY